MIRPISARPATAPAAIPAAVPAEMEPPPSFSESGSEDSEAVDSVGAGSEVDSESESESVSVEEVMELVGEGVSDEEEEAAGLVVTLVLGREDLLSSLAVVVGLVLAVVGVGGARTLVVRSLVSTTTSAASCRGSSVRSF